MHSLVNTATVTALLSTPKVTINLYLFFYSTIMLWPLTGYLLYRLFDRECLHCPWLAVSSSNFSISSSHLQWRWITTCRSNTAWPISATAWSWRALWRTRSATLESGWRWHLPWNDTSQSATRWKARWVNNTQCITTDVILNLYAMMLSIYLYVCLFRVSVCLFICPPVAKTRTQKHSFLKKQAI